MQGLTNNIIIQEYLSAVVAIIYNKIIYNNIILLVYTKSVDGVFPHSGYSIFSFLRKKGTINSEAYYS